MRTKRAFTLVELLIVIVVIGILAGVMVISGNETMASAKANTAILTMKDLKRATLEWYTDNFGGNLTFENDNGNLYAIAYKGISPRPRSIHNIFKNHPEFRPDLTKYCGNPSILINSNGNDPGTNEDGYAIIDSSAMGSAKKDDTINKYQRWYVAYQVPKDNPKINQKLAARAQKEGLLKNDQDPYDGSTNYVYMLIKDLAEDQPITF